MEPALISDNNQPAPKEIMDHQYLNMMDNYITDDGTVEPREYRHLIKCDNHKKHMGEIFFQQVRTSSTRSWRPSKRHQHNFFPGT